MSRAYLLPHEAPCPNCDDGRIWIECPGQDEMLATGRFETCGRCDGTSVIVNDRRVEQPELRAILDQLLAAHREPVIRALREDGEQIETHVATINRLERENAALRRINRHLTLLLDQAEPRDRRTA